LQSHYLEDNGTQPKLVCQFSEAIEERSHRN
jgi:hypothetical protein